MFAQAPEDEFARAVRAGLTGAGQKTLPCSYFYDDIGSALFEAITCLPEYGLTRADTRLVQCHAAEIVAAVPGNVIVVELGSGSGGTARPILENLGRRQRAVYYPVDVSPAALERCARELAGVAEVFPLESNYLDGLGAVTAERRPGQRLLVLFLGSTIGNFELEAATGFLGGVRAFLKPGDALLLGTDLVKDRERMLTAYDDPTGVTAAFNLNLLGRINRELDADFDLHRFEHVARYNAAAQRIEMHLRARVGHSVSIRKLELVIDFVACETIWTETSQKFRPEQIGSMARAAGFRVERQWIDPEWPFAETLTVAI